MISQQILRKIPGRLCIVIVSLSLLISCSGPDPTYFPLQSGYKWRYDVAMTTRDGLEKQKYILNNLGPSKLNSEPVYARQSLDGTLLYYAIEDDEIRYLGSDSRDVPGGQFKPDQQIVMKQPLELNTNWETTSQTRLLKKTGPPQKTEFRIVARVPLDVLVESLSETVSVPAGIFSNCLKIRMTGSMMKDAGNYVGMTLINVEETRWYAPGVGLVKLERLETTQSDALDKGSLLVELADYDVG